MYQERLVFNYFRNITKRYLENKENAHSSKKMPRASRILRWALDPGLLNPTSLHREIFPKIIFVLPLDQSPGSATVSCTNMLELVVFIMKKF